MAKSKTIKKIKPKIKGLTLQFIPYSEIEDSGTSERIKKLLAIVLQNKIIILQGKLRPEEETRLIEDTMAMVEHIKGFKGVELAVISPNQNKMPLIGKLKHGIAKRLVGETDSLTIIGPASIVRDIKRDPKKIEIMMKR